MEKLEKKIRKLKTLCSKYETAEFLTLLAGILLQMPTRHENPFLKKLMSPMRQLFYLALVNLQRDPVKNKKGFSAKEWDEMAMLLHEIEIEYFYLLGFPRNGKETSEEIEKIKVTMPTFMNYFFNGPLSYQEQEIERIENVFARLDPSIEETFGVTVADFIAFYDTVSAQVNINLNKAIHFLNPENWKAFTSECIAKGLMDPRQWIEEAPEELQANLNFQRNPGSVLQLDLDKIDYSRISRAKLEKIFLLFTCQPQPKADITYYTEDNELLKRPFIAIDEKTFLSFYSKQYLNACYDLLFSHFMSVDSDKVLKARDKFMEKKTEQLFRKLFGNEAFYYVNYSIDGGTSEQDLLVIYKSFAIAIEIKAAGYRAPMRDFSKAFDKLNTDFKKNIENAYDQLFRVRTAFNSGEKKQVLDEKKRVLYELPTKKYELYTIIVTLERFGHIQTNLEDMLELQPGDDYPWAVCIDDLEAFLLTFIKRKMKLPAFLNFLHAREKYHGHLLCGDELELCGSFFKDQEQFRYLSSVDETIVTEADLTTPIEDAYRQGMGFENERYMAEKADPKISFLYTDKLKKEK